MALIGGYPTNMTFTLTETKTNCSSSPKPSEDCLAWINFSSIKLLNCRLTCSAISRLRMS